MPQKNAPAALGVPTAVEQGIPHAAFALRIRSSGGDLVKRLKFWGAILILVGILIRPESAVAGAQRAMRLWYSSVAPAMFPFLALLPVLTGPEACAAYDAAFSRLMRPTFNLPGAAAPALVIGMISGSPGGAIATRRVAAAANLRRSDAKRIALAVSGVSPAYLILGVGQGLYSSVALGVRLALIQIAIQMGLLLLLRGIIEDDAEVVADQDHMENVRGPIQTAVESILAVCGYMVLFSSVCCVAASFTGETAGTALLLVSDLPSGLASLSQWNFPGKMLIQGAAIGFGGLCIAAQNLDALRELGVTIAEYFSMRGIAAACFAAICGLALRSQGIGQEIYAGNGMRTYAYSLLIAGIAALPALFFLTKTFLINNRKSEE